MRASFNWQRPERADSQVNAVVTVSSQTQIETIEAQRAHWRKLHTTRLTETEFEDWVRQIPGCVSCQRDFRKLIETIPPRFHDWHKWTFEVHNAVNAKLGKPNITFEEACKQWGWD